MMPERVIDRFADASRHGQRVTGVELPSMEGDSVLDLCAGAGVYGHELFARGAREVVWHDVNARLLEVAKQELREHAEVRFELQDLEALDIYPDERFDGVFFREALHHSKDEGRTLRELARILRPGGWLYLAFPTYRRYTRAGHRLRLLDQSLRVALYSATGLRLRPGFCSRRRVRRELSAAGFSVQASASYGFCDAVLARRE